MAGRCKAAVRDDDIVTRRPAPDRMAQSHASLVERLLGLAEVIEPARRPKRPSGGESIAARVEALATRLADDARVKAYEIVGNRERAVSIMERRLGA